MKTGICVHCSSPISIDIVQQDQNTEYEISIYMIHTNLSNYQNLYLAVQSI